MKKIISCLLVCCMLLGSLLTLSSCGTAQTLERAIEKTERLDDFHAEMSMVITTTANGVSVSVPVSIEMKVKDADKDEPIIWAELSATVMGQTVESEIYCEKDMIYTLTDGVGTKERAEDSEEDHDYDETVEDMLQELPKSVLEDVEFEKNDDGSKTATIELSGELFKDIFEEVVEDLNDGNAEDVEVDNAEVVITIEKGYVVDYDISFEMIARYGGTRTVTEVEMEVEFIDPGKRVTITPPKDYKDFDWA